LRSADEHTPLPFDKKTGELKLDLVRVGEKLKTTTAPPKPKGPKPILRMSSEGVEPAYVERDEDYLDIQLMPAAKEDDNSTAK